MQKKVDAADVFHASQFDILRVTSTSVAKETRRDLVLARVHESIVKGVQCVSKETNLVMNVETN